jgi:hypothetical protein
VHPSCLGALTAPPSPPPPKVIVSHDREFLDQLSTKIVETERGVSSTYAGNYTDYIRQKVGGGAWVGLVGLVGWLVG